MFRGFATVSFYADDLAAARDWYTELLGVEPYYAFPPPPAEPAYLEFRVGDDEDELGIIDRRYAPGRASGGPGGASVAPGGGPVAPGGGPVAPGGAVVFWHVDDLDATVAKLRAMGATEYEPVIAREAGFVTASFVDPFGNVLGVMNNPHYLEVQAARPRG
ncbi:VOC family protein [Georgenia faecalis]|uniref:VOC family protein n=1 Tax=Georgenia faecalis TaxID=2483799 RepID=A0ABV9D9M2_9MICO|nr:VOC family protein [Georgenia faecalis]